MADRIAGPTGLRRPVSAVADALRHAKDQGGGATVLIGAGCSVTARIPTAASMADEVRRRYPGHTSAATSDSYGDVMASLPKETRIDLINKYVEQSSLNRGHLVLAWLMKQGFVGRVLTTNFDNVLVRSCALQNCFPAVYDFAVTHGVFEQGRMREPAVVYLHGQSAGFVQLHT